jgi:hypothetical protein
LHSCISNLETKWKDEKPYRKELRKEAWKAARANGSLTEEMSQEIDKVYNDMYADIVSFGRGGPSKKRRVTASVVGARIGIDHGVTHVMAGLNGLPRGTQKALRLEGKEPTPDMGAEKMAGASVDSPSPSPLNQSFAADAFEEKPDETKRYNGESDCESGRWFDDGSIQSGRNPSSPRASLDRATRGLCGIHSRYGKPSIEDFRRRGKVPRLPAYLSVPIWQIESFCIH